jgi:hypothetical protein
MKRVKAEDVFFLHPENPFHPEDTKPWYEVGSGPAAPGCSLVLLFGGPFLGADMLWHLIAAKLEWQSFRENGVTVSARIVDVDTDRGQYSDGEAVVIYQLRYAFEVPEGGRRYERQVSLGESQARPILERQTVDVIYRPGDPSFSRLPSEVPVAEWTRGDLAGLLCFGGLPILVPLAAVLTERAQRRQRRASTQVFQGEVLTCTVAYDDEHVFQVTLTCRFRTPRGRAVELTRRVPRNDLSPQQLPPAGTPVLVRYTPPTPGMPAVIGHAYALGSEIL